MSHKLENNVLDVGSPFWESEVRAEMFRLKVRREARLRYEQELAGAFPVHDGVLAYGDLPSEPPELLEGVLLAHGATGIVAEKEAGKSLTALEIQSSLLTGTPLWGEIKPSKTVAKTVHFLAEHTSTTLQGLYHRTRLPHAGELRIFGPEHLGPHKLLVSSGVRREAAVSYYKKLAEGAGLVVFDPLASFIQGQSAENDNSPMRNLIDTMIEIAQSTGAACLVLGHQGKPAFVNGHKVRKSSYATRGASSSEDAMTAVHYLDRVPNVKFGRNEVFELRAIHYKGIKPKPFQLIRDATTCRQTLVTRAIDLDNFRRPANEGP